MKKLVGNLVVVLVGVAAFILARPVGQEMREWFQGDLTQAEAENAILNSESGEFYAALKGYFPDEAEYFRTELYSLAKKGASEEEVFSKMQVVGAEIRRRHAESLRFAPDASLWQVLQTQIQFLSAFERDPTTCNRVGMYGPIAIPEHDRDRVMEIIGPAPVIFRAMYEGETNPVERTTPSDADYENLLVEFLAAGGTEEELILIGEPDVTNSALCGALVRFVKAAANAEFDGADRIRAELAVEMGKE